MNENKNDIIEFIISSINDFADFVGLTEHQAFLYLKNHNAIDFMVRHYGVMHTLAVAENMESLINFCRKERGRI